MLISQQREWLELGTLDPLGNLERDHPEGKEDKFC
jgi:hypothetical protein